jgi:hypothetical protein
MEIRKLAFFSFLFLMISFSLAQAQECKEYWVCTDWSFCLGSGVQMRSCTDVNRCPTEREKPIETQACVPEPVREVEVPQAEETSPVTGLLVSNTPAILGIVALALGVAVYLVYRKWRDIRLFISAP